MADTLVLGIDPGSHRLGYGLVIRRGNKYVHVAHGMVKAPSTALLPERLRVIADGLEAVLGAHKPDVMALEQAFVSRDPHAALVIGHARGVAMLLAARAGLSVVEYPPAVVKRSVTGNGRAEKSQVGAMIQRMLGLAEPAQEDAADALAVAITHANATGLAALLKRA